MDNPEVLWQNYLQFFTAPSRTPCNGAYPRHTGRFAHAVLHAPLPVSAEGRKGMTASTLPGWKLPRAPVSRYITAAPPLCVNRSRGLSHIVLPCISRPVPSLSLFVSRLRGIVSCAASRFSLSSISPARYPSRRIPALIERYGRGRRLASDKEPVSCAGLMFLCISLRRFPCLFFALTTSRNTPFWRPRFPFCRNGGRMQATALSHNRLPDGATDRAINA